MQSSSMPFSQPLIEDVDFIVKKFLGNQDLVLLPQLSHEFARLFNSNKKFWVDKCYREFSFRVRRSYSNCKDLYKRLLKFKNTNPERFYWFRKNYFELALTYPPLHTSKLYQPVSLELRRLYLHDAIIFDNLPLIHYLTNSYSTQLILSKHALDLAAEHSSLKTFVFIINYFAKVNFNYKPDTQTLNKTFLSDDIRKPQYLLQLDKDQVEEKGLNLTETIIHNAMLSGSREMIKYADELCVENKITYSIIYTQCSRQRNNAPGIEFAFTHNKLNYGNLDIMDSSFEFNDFEVIQNVRKYYLEKNSGNRHNPFYATHLIYAVYSPYCSVKIFNYILDILSKESPSDIMQFIQDTYYTIDEIFVKPDADFFNSILNLFNENNYEFLEEKDLNNAIKIALTSTNSNLELVKALLDSHKNRGFILSNEYFSLGLAAEGGSPFVFHYLARHYYLKNIDITLSEDIIDIIIMRKHLGLLTYILHTPIFGVSITEALVKKVENTEDLLLIDNLEYCRIILAQDKSVDLGNFGMKPQLSFQPQGIN